MPSKLGRGLLIFVLLVIAVASWQWIDERDIEQPAASNRIEMAETQSDYYLENFEIKNISNKSDNSESANGSSNQSATEYHSMPADRQLNITGQSLSHHYIEGYSVIENPTVNLRSTDNGQWNARASSGTVSANFDVLNLQGNVELTHNRANIGSNIDSQANYGTNSQTNQDIKVETNSLSIDTGNRTISSTEPVQVEGDGWNYSANAMDAEIDRGTLTFKSDVEAQFESPNNR